MSRYGLERIKMDISIIIPLYKGNKYCHNLLNMIEENLLYRNLYRECSTEVIFVNDYPGETITLGDETYKCTVNLINQSINVGIHASRVRGLDAAKGKYIIMLDQDDVVEERWLYSQWNKIRREKGEYCVCNGWKRRFQTLWTENIMKKNVNNLQSYLEGGNPIMSPGQVIIKREAVPVEWLSNVQGRNGADDFLLWILALKQGHSFVLNAEYLFYHTPERTVDSVSTDQMNQSLKESLAILDSIGVLIEEERTCLHRYIEWKTSIGDTQAYKKFYAMFWMLFNWTKLRNQGIYIHTYLKGKGYVKVAIYGMGHIGECLYEELENTDIKVLYGIDRMALDYKRKLPICCLDAQLETVDAVIITVSGNCQNLKRELAERMKCPIYTINELLTEISKDKKIT